MNIDIDFNNEQFLDLLQTKCLQVQDNNAYSEKFKERILNIGAWIFILQCKLTKNRGKHEYTPLWGSI